jgi:TonB family protein
MAIPTSLNSTVQADRPNAARCGIELVSNPTPRLPASDNRKAVTLQTPMVRFSIAEDGAVSKAKLVKSSNVRSWDKAILETVKTWKFAEGRGCGTRRATLSVNIDPHE